MNRLSIPQFVSSGVTPLLWMPLKNGALWSLGGIALGLWLPNHLASRGLIYSPRLVSMVVNCGGSLAILLPTGVARGIIASAKRILIDQGRVHYAMQQLTQYPSTKMGFTTDQNPKQIWEKLTLGSGWRGKLFRFLASPFLPSTVQMMNRLQKALDTKDPFIVAAAATGFVEGFLQDKQKTITVAGLILYGVVWCVAIGLDIALRRNLDFGIDGAPEEGEGEGGVDI